MKSAGGVQNGLVLRVSVPSSGEFTSVGTDIAAKLAEQLAIAPPHAARVAAAIGELARQVDRAGAAEVSFEFHKIDAELKVEARQDDRTADTRVPLSA